MGVVLLGLNARARGSASILAIAAQKAPPLEKSHRGAVCRTSPIGMG